MKKSPITARFHHVGMIVKDADKAAAFYESLGLGPFEGDLIKGGVAKRELRGKPLASLKTKSIMAHVGPTRIEFIQPIEGQGPWFEFMAQHGEGIAHIGFVVDDVEAAIAELVKRGLKVIYRAWFNNGGHSVYVGSEGMGGIIFELFQRPDDYVPREKTKKIEKIARSE